MLSALGGILSGSNPAADALVAAGQLKKAVAQRDFVDDCLALALINIFRADKEHSSQDLYCDHNRGLRARLFFWPPGFETLPHRHSAWTCSAVLVNVVMFRRHKELDDGEWE